jgi:hypothetical protein
MRYFAMCKPGEGLPVVLQTVLALALISFFPLLVSGAEIAVNCPAESLNTAINLLPPMQANTITVAGTCNEQIDIAFQDRLTIQGSAGATIEYAESGPVVRINNSRAIVLRGLLIKSAKRDGVEITRSVVTVDGSAIQGNARNGIYAMQESAVAVFNSTLSNNYRGIRADSSFLEVNGGVKVQNNRFHGISCNLSTVKFSGPPYTNEENIVSDNGFDSGSGLGVLVGFGTRSEWQGQNTIKHNKNGGVQVNATSYANFIGRDDGTTTIEGHEDYGIMIEGTSTVYLSGPVIIRKNGSNGAGPGIFARQNASLAIMNLPEISNNAGPGVWAEDNATIQTNGAKILDNSAEGIRLRHLSTAEFMLGDPPTVISGNGIAAIACDDSSIPYGDLTGISPINCKNYQPVKTKK